MLNRLVHVLLALVVALANCLGGGGTALARSIAPLPPQPGTLPPRPAPPQFLVDPTGAIHLEAMEVRAEVHDGVAAVRVVQAFRNRLGRMAEGTYLFPLPAGAVVSHFQLRVDGEDFGAELLDAGQARAIYESIVAQNRDPALLQYVGRGMIQARVFPIPPGAERRVELAYDQMLAQAAGTYELTLPAGGAPQVEVEVHLQTGAPLRTLYSPTHEVTVARDGDRRATVTYRGGNAAGPRDLHLFFGGGDTVAASLLTYRTGSEDGYFLLSLMPPADVSAAEALPRDVVLVLDTSGSMAGIKLTQAKEALRFVLERLNPADRFNVVGFASSVRTYAETLRPQSEWRNAASWVDSLQAVGGTNIDGALNTALDLARAGAESGRPQFVIFLTDGLPTVGLSDPQAILDKARRLATRDQRVYTFGVGYDVNTDLLDGLADQFRGVSAYIAPEEDLEDRISRFYSQVAQPVLADLALTYDGVRVYDVYPVPLPDLFAGGQLTVMGRYNGEGTARVTLKGTAARVARTFTFEDLTFARREQLHAFIPRLWAGRKIAYLLTQVRQDTVRGGGDREVVDEIVALSLRYGILTPYTSFLVQEPANGPAGPRREAAPGQAAMDSIASAPASGAGAVSQARAVNQLKTATSVQAQSAPALPSPAGLASGAGAETALPIRQVTDRTFVFRSGVWTDTAYAEGMPLTEVPFGSVRYFELARQYPEAFGVGLPLIVVLSGAAYRITDTGAPAEIPPAPAETVSARPGGPALAAPPGVWTWGRSIPALGAGMVAVTAAAALGLRRWWH